MIDSKVIPFTLVLLFLLLIQNSETLAQKVDPGSRIKVTEHFDFHNNFWLNMHHMWFQKASQARDTIWQNSFDESFISKLKESEKKALENTMGYYRDNLVGNSLLFNGVLYRLKRTLINFGPEDEVMGEELPAEVFEALNSTSSIYKKYFWKDHKSQNQLILQKNLELIEEFESAAVKRISNLAQQPWPEGKVRVDISYYSNWAGAYTTINPEVHVVITSQDEGPVNDWLELLFHEPSHAVISNNEYKVAEIIAQVSDELGLEVPRNLWHSLLFYFSGVTIQDLLEEKGIDYELYMVRNQVFDRHHKVIFEYMPEYVKGKATLEKALENLITSYNQY